MSQVEQVPVRVVEAQMQGPPVARAVRAGEVLGIALAEEPVHVPEAGRPIVLPERERVRFSLD